MTKCKYLIPFALALGVLAYLLYTPVPRDLDDAFAVMMMVAAVKISITFPQTVREYLGQGRHLDNLKVLQSGVVSEGDLSPMTSWFGGLNVTRATIEGMHVILYRHWDTDTTPLRPGSIYFHGGGWVFANADSFDWTIYDLAVCSGTVMVSVDYRLAPQHPFPAAFDDAVAAIRHVLRHGARYGIDVTRVGVSGDSSGANLAAAAALHLTRAPVPGLPPLKFQTLTSPILQFLNYRLPSYRENDVVLPGISAKHVAAYATLYLGLGEKGDYHGEIFAGNRHVNTEMLIHSKYSSYVNESNLPERYRRSRRTGPIADGHHDDGIFERIKEIIVDPRVSPLMADDLSGLPPTHIAVEKFDVVRDDGLLYAKRLRDAGVPTRVHMGNGYHLNNVKMVPDFLFSRSGAKSMQSTCKFLSAAGNGDWL